MPRRFFGAAYGYNKYRANNFIAYKKCNSCGIYAAQFKIAKLKN